MDKILRQNQAFILIAPGFDEEAVVHCLCQMRQRGTAVSENPPTETRTVDTPASVATETADPESILSGESFIL